MQRSQKINRKSVIVPRARGPGLPAVSKRFPENGQRSARGQFSEAVTRGRRQSTFRAQGNHEIGKAGIPALVQRSARGVLLCSLGRSKTGHTLGGTFRNIPRARGCCMSGSMRELVRVSAKVSKRSAEIPAFRGRGAVTFAKLARDFRTVRARADGQVIGGPARPN